MQCPWRHRALVTPWRPSRPRQPFPDRRGITPIGNPTRASEPITEALLNSCETWLQFERRYLHYERTGAVSEITDDPFVGRDGKRDDATRMDNAGGPYHDRDDPGVSPGAALVLSAVGCEWRRS